MPSDDCDIPLTAPQVLEVLELLGPQSIEGLHEAFRDILTKEELVLALEYLIRTRLVLLWERPEGAYQALCRSPLFIPGHSRHGTSP